MFMIFSILSFFIIHLQFILSIQLFNCFLLVFILPLIFYVHFDWFIFTHYFYWINVNSLNWWSLNNCFNIYYFYYLFICWFEFSALIPSSVFGLSINILISSSYYSCYALYIPYVWIKGFIVSSYYFSSPPLPLASIVFMFLVLSFLLLCTYY